jgi:hypothetical protein
MAFSGRALNQKGGHHLRSHQHGSLKVVSSPILNDIGHHYDGYEEDRRLKQVKIQRHGLLKYPTQNHHQGEDQESDLKDAADEFPDRPVNALAGAVYDPDVIREVSDHRDDHEAKECFADAHCGSIDTANQVGGAQDQAEG